MKLKPERPVRRDAPIVAHLKARGLRARIVVERIDGAAMTEEDIREAGAALVAFEETERRAWKAFAEGNREAPQKRTPPTANPKKPPSKRTAARKPSR